MGASITAGAIVCSLKILNDKINYDEKKAIVYQILDKDRINGLSNEEKKVFNDVTGISPYDHTFDSASDKELDLFLKKYINK